jgi:hypothetical protein
MKNHSLFVALLCYKQWIMIISFFTFFLRDEIDFARRSDLFLFFDLFKTQCWSVFSSWFFLRSLSFLFSCFSFIDCRLDYCEIIISYYFFFIDDHDAMIVKWSSTKKRKLLKRRKEASTKLCCVECVSLIRKRVRNRENSESRNGISS